LCLRNRASMYLPPANHRRKMVSRRRLEDGSNRNRGGAMKDYAHAPISLYAAPERHTLIASDRVEGTPVRRTGGEKIGRIERLMIDKLSGKVAYAVLTFGGFLGLGEKHLPIPWERLKYDPSISSYHLDLTDEELKRAPSYGSNEEFDWGDRSNEIEIHGYYKVPRYW
jgi:hypothetical protein